MQFRKALQYTVLLKLFNSFLSFAINLAMVRILGVSESGNFFYLIAALSLIILVLSFSLESGFTYYSTNNTGNTSSILLLIFGLLLLQTVISYLVIDRILAAPHIIFATLYVTANIATGYITALYAARKWFTSLNNILFFVNLFGAMALAFVYFNYGSTEAIQLYLPQKIFILIFVGQALLLILFFLVRKKSAAYGNRSPISFSTIFQYAAVAFIGNLLFFLATRVDYYFVEKYCDAASLSNYVQVTKLGQLLILVPSIVATVIFPFASDNVLGLTIDKIQSLCRMLVIFFIPVLSGAIAFGYWLFPWLFGNGFTKMYVAMLCYLPGFFALSIVALLAAYLAGKAMLRDNIFASALTLLIVVCGDIFLVPKFGINAAAAISSLGYLIGMLYLLWVYQQKLQAKWKAFFCFKKADVQSIIAIIKKRKIIETDQ